MVQRGAFTALISVHEGPWPLPRAALIPSALSVQAVGRHSPGWEAFGTSHPSESF